MTTPHNDVVGSLLRPGERHNAQNDLGSGDMT